MRRCSRPGCETILSRANLGDRCSVHELPDKPGAYMKESKSTRLRRKQRAKA